MIGRMFADASIELLTQVGPTAYSSETIPKRAIEMIIKLVRENGGIPLGVENRVSGLEFQPPKADAPIEKWQTPLTEQPTVGATPPSAIYATWRPSHWKVVQKAEKRARAAIPTNVPELSTTVKRSTFDDFL